MFGHHVFAHETYPVSADGLTTGDGFLDIRLRFRFACAATVSVLVEVKDAGLGAGRRISWEALLTDFFFLFFTLKGFGPPFVFPFFCSFFSKRCAETVECEIVFCGWSARLGRII